VVLGCMRKVIDGIAPNVERSSCHLVQMRLPYVGASPFD
jgi:hypothetical protein